MDYSGENPADNQSANNNSDTLVEFNELQKYSKVVEDMIVLMNNKLCNIDESKLNSVQKEEYRSGILWLIFRKT